MYDSIQLIFMFLGSLLSGVSTVFLLWKCHSVGLTLQPYGLQPATLCPWNSPGKNTEVGSHFLLQGIFSTQRSNAVFLLCRQILYRLSHQGSPVYIFLKNVVSNINLFKLSVQFSSVQFTRSVVSDSLRPHGLQHARPPCPSPTPWVHSDSQNNENCLCVSVSLLDSSGLGH